jgi:hypothetical protein
METGENQRQLLRNQELILSGSGRSFRMFAAE